ncbi:hypothetical protein CF104_19865 [Aeromonas jandaei]|nr:hypothetical protein CF104_19865 [Aeromonas jandaei]
MSQQGARRANVIWTNKAALGGQSLFLAAFDQTEQPQTFDFHPLGDSKEPIVAFLRHSDKIVLAIGGGAN